MLLNDLKRDWKVLLASEGITQTQAGEIVGKAPQYLSQSIGRNGNITTGMIEIYEKLGYDIQITYMKRQK